MSSRRKTSLSVYTEWMTMSKSCRVSAWNSCCSPADGGGGGVGAAAAVSVSVLRGRPQGGRRPLVPLLFLVKWVEQMSVRDRSTINQHHALIHAPGPELRPHSCRRQAVASVRCCSPIAHVISRRHQAPLQRRQGGGAPARVGGRSRRGDRRRLPAARPRQEEPLRQHGFLPVGVGCWVGQCSRKRAQ